MKRDRRRGRAFLLAPASLALLASGLVAQDVGYEGPSYTGSSLEPTESKPESKLWFNDGIWWGSLWSVSAQAFRIHKLDQATHVWTDTGVLIDSRSNSKGDALWDGTKLYVGSHRFSSDGGASGNSILLLRYSYNASTDVYTLDTGFPVTIGTFSTESLVIDKDSTGTVWAAWVQGLRVYVNHSVGGNDLTWSSPGVLPGSNTNLTDDEVCSLTHFGGNKIGVMWSDQALNLFRFAVHQDGAADNVWTLETPLAGESDDHVNLATDAAGRVFATVKNAQNEIKLLVRDGGVWSQFLVSTGVDRFSRPIVLLDEESRLVHVFANGQDNGLIHEKTCSLDALGFAPGTGRVVIRDASNALVSNPTSTKQNVDSTTGLVVLAAHETSSMYWHHSVAPAALLVASFSADPTSGSVPLSVQFTDTSTGTPTAWLWDFGDGGSSTQQDPVHVYAGPGTFDVSLTVTRPGGSDQEIWNDLITAAPALPVQTFPAVADARVNEAAPGSNAGTATELRLRFAAGGSYQSYLRFNLSALSGPVASAKLRLFCTDGSVVGGIVFPTANTWTETGITWNNKPAATGGQLAALGSITPNTWVEYDVTAGIGAPGSYDFLLTTTSSNSAIFSSREGANPPELVVQIEAPAPPVAEFTASTTSGTAPLSVTFSDLSTGAPTSWAWDFGDGGTSTAQNPVHVYTSAGTFSVSLTVVDPGGSDSASKTDYIVVSGPPAPVAGFSASPTSGTAPLSVTFTDASSGDITSRSWNFGDGGSSTATNPTHQYASPGSYTVSLTVTGPGGSDDETKVDHIAVSAAPPVAGFSASPTSGTAPLSVTFTDASTGNITSRSWNFGDGGTSTATSPTHVYNSTGLFSVTLTVTGPGGSDGETKIDHISVSAPQAGQTLLPVADARVNQSSPTSNAGTANELRLRFETGGSYQSYLRFDLSGLSGSVTSAKLRLFCTDGSNLGGTVFPTSNGWTETGITWNNKPAATGASIGTFGTFVTGQWGELDVTSAIGALGPISFQVTNATSNSALFSSREGANPPQLVVQTGAAQPPVADFSGTPTSGTAPLTVAFTDASIGNITSRSWSFGDGGSSTAVSPSHVYASAGTYDVTLTVTGPAGSDGETKTGFIVVSPPGAPVAGFSASPTSGPAPLSVTFTDASTGNITSRSWSFGDGGTSTATSPTHVYTNTGLFSVTLTVTGPGGSDGETKVDHISVTTAPPIQTLLPVADARVSQSSPTSNAGTANELRLRFDATGAYQSYLRFDLSGLSGSVTSAKLRLFCTDGSNLGGTVFPTSNGWTETGITWNNKPAATGALIGTFGTFVTGQWAELDVTSAIGTLGPISFQVTNATSNSALFSSREGANPPQLVVETGAAQPPVADFSGTPTAGAAPLSVAFTDLSTNGPTSWSWDFGDGTGSTQRNPVHVYASPGNFSVSLTATNGLGSSSKLRTNYVSVTSAPPITTFTPLADARVNESSPTSNAGTATELRTRFAAGGSYNSYLRFDLSTISASIVSAKLRLFCTDESPQGGLVFPTSSAWTETTINWNNRPAATGGQIAALGAVTNGAWVEVDVTAAIGTPGLESYLLTATTSNSALFSSREGANPPQLVVETAAP